MAAAKGHTSGSPPGTFLSLAMASGSTSSGGPAAFGSSSAPAFTWNGRRI